VPMRWVMLGVPPSQCSHQAMSATLAFSAVSYRMPVSRRWFGFCGHRRVGSSACVAALSAMPRGIRVVVIGRCDGVPTPRVQASLGAVLPVARVRAPSQVQRLLPGLSNAVRRVIVGLRPVRSSSTQGEHLARLSRDLLYEENPAAGAGWTRHPGAGTGGAAWCMSMSPRSVRDAGLVAADAVIGATWAGVKELRNSADQDLKAPAARLPGVRLPPAPVEPLRSGERGAFVVFLFVVGDQFGQGVTDQIGQGEDLFGLAGHLGVADDAGRPLMQ
jgi:hypothetical protein